MVLPVEGESTNNLRVNAALVGKVETVCFESTGCMEAGSKGTDELIFNFSVSKA